MKTVVKIGLLLLSITLSCFLHAQKEDYNWFMGSGGGPFGKNHFVFNPNLEQVDSVTQNLGNFNRTNASISDSLGSFLYYTNGRALFDSSHQIIPNGDSLNFGYTWLLVEPALYYTCPQGALMLNEPNSINNKQEVFHLFYDSIFDPSLPGAIGAMNLKLSEIVSENSSSYTSLKNEILVNDTVLGGAMSACRHANGRDWWILCSEVYSNCFYTMLLEPNNISIKKNVCSGVIQQYYGASAFSVFSNDGNYYVRGTYPYGIEIFYFDRCSGTLTLKEHIPLESIMELPEPLFFFLGEVVISANSRYLYCGPVDSLYQFDLLASDIASTKLLVRGINPDSVNTPGFIPSHLGPDGKIYAHIGNFPLYSVMHNPDTLAPFTDVEVQIPYPNGNNGSFSFGNFPNFRLGRMIGSECDTIYNNITSFSEQLDLFLYPNPSSSSIQIDYGAFQWSSSSSLQLEIRNVLGELMFKHELPEYSAIQAYEIANFPSGVYFVSLTDRNIQIGNAKFVKQ